MLFLNFRGRSDFQANASKCPNSGKACIFEGKKKKVTYTQKHFESGAELARGDVK